ncbi:MAG: hypothetical protein GY750_17640 [Lentisphaerae bacterium]|nr:hypothetical protein [Lentisphaerota bacterium]MCP4103222.1 hypothetical protein [Lentisphaerota bacterium]
MQVHSPTNRVWKWVYKNRQAIINHAKYVADVVKKIKVNEFTAGDAFDIVGQHLGNNG